jgi:hypothetical protein
MKNDEWINQTLQGTISCDCSGTQQGRKALFDTPADKIK